MRPQQLMGAAGIFILGTMLACIASGRWLLGGETNIINALASFNTVSVDAGGFWSVPKNTSAFISACVTALSWNYPFLSSAWAFVVKIPLWLISIGVVYGLITLAFSAISGFIGAIRRIV